MLKPCTLASVLVTLLAACSGGGSDPGSKSAAAGLQAVVISTESGSSARVEAKVDAVALERHDGSMTDDLLGGSRIVVLADPLGRPESLDLVGVPSGEFKVVHLMVSGMVAIDEHGKRESIESSSLNVSFLLNPGTQVDPGEVWRIRHVRRLELRKNAKGQTNWNPSLSLGVGDVAPLRHAHVELITVDETKGLIEGLLLPFGRTVHVRLDVLSDALVLGRDPWRLIHARDIYQHVEVGQRVTVEGWMTQDRILQLTYLELPPQRKVDHRLHGWVTNLDPATESFDVHVIEFLSEDTVQPLVYRVDTTSALVHRTGSPHLSLPFGAFMDGDNVVIEWRDPWLGGLIHADRVELLDASAGDPDPMSMGAIGSLDVGAGKVGIVPWNGKPLVFEGQRVSALDLKLDSRTLIYRRSKKEPVSLRDLVVGQKIWIRGRTVTGQKIDVWELRINR